MATTWRRRSSDSPPWSSGWTGQDPRLRLLRSVAALVILILLAFVVVEPTPNDPTTIGALVGALLDILGFEAAVRWLGQGRRRSLTTPGARSPV